MIFHAFTYRLRFKLFSLLTLFFYLKINGQQKLCLGSKKVYSVDLNEIINKDEKYSWHIQSNNFRGEINSLNSIGNQIEIDWKDTNVGTYRLVVNKSNSCTSIQSELEIILENNVELNMPTLYYMCPDKLSIQLNAPTGYQSYQWLNDQNKILSNTQNIIINSIGNYRLNVFDGNCLNYSDFEVINFQFPQIKIIDRNTNTIFIELNESIDDYLFQLEDNNGKIIFNWQSSPKFERINKGDYIVKIKSKIAECITSLQSKIYAIPDLITPNGDGYNDYWDLTEYKNISSIKLFDRYGKKILNLNSPETMKWDGKVNGRNLPSTTYWYQIKMDNGQIIEGSLTIRN